MTKLTRRTLMKAAAATGLAGALGSRVAFAADEPLGITLVVPSPIGDVGWGHALSASLEGDPEAIDVGLAEALLSLPVADPDPRLLRRQSVGELTRAVGAVVVDDQERGARQALEDGRRDALEIVDLVIGGQHDPGVGEGGILHRGGV